MGVVLKEIQHKAVRDQSYHPQMENTKLLVDLFNLVSAKTIKLAKVAMHNNALGSNFKINILSVCKAKLVVSTRLESHCLSYIHITLHRLHRQNSTA